MSAPSTPKVEIRLTGYSPAETVALATPKVRAVIDAGKKLAVALNLGNERKKAAAEAELTRAITAAGVPRGQQAAVEMLAREVGQARQEFTEILPTVPRKAAAREHSIQRSGYYGTITRNSNGYVVTVDASRGDIAPTVRAAEQALIRSLQQRRVVVATR